jgi:hypothetical protein
MPKNTARVVVGRLLEVRAAAGYHNAAEVDAIFEQIGQALSTIQGQRQVTVVDWRDCPVMAPEAAAHMVQLIAAANDTTERSAALARIESPTAVLQFVRVIREAALPDRRLFDNPDKLCHWLDEVLSPAESERLRVFLNENPEATESDADH